MRQLTLPAIFSGRKAKPNYVRAALRKAPLRRRMPRWLARALLPGSMALFGISLITGGAIGWRAGLDDVFSRLALGWSSGAGFEVREVLVEDRKETTREQILRALGVERGSPLFEFSPDDAHERLVALGWVEDALVERRLPDTIYVRLKERNPAAIWQRKGSFTLVDASGAVIGADRIGRYNHLRVIVGEDAPAHFADLFAALATRPALAGRVTAAVRVGRRRWNLRMDTGVTVLLPETAAAAAWLRFAALAEKSGLLERDITRVDLRIPDRIAIRLSPQAALRARGDGA